MTAVLGLDLSLTATGYALHEEVVGVFKSKSTGAQRLAEIQDFIMEWAHRAEVVVLEGYSYASVNQAYKIGELGGVIRMSLWVNRIPYAVVPPKTRAKFATGRGNADKDATLAAAIRRFGFEGDSNDAADAWLLRCMGLVHYDAVPIALPGNALEALGKVEWPKLGAEVSA